MSPNHIDDLARGATTVAFEAGEAIVNQGEEATSFYVIKEGSASVSVDGTVRQTLERGAGFGEVGLFGGGGRAATVTATASVEAVRIDESSLRSAFGTDSVNIRPLKAIIEEYSTRAE